MTNNRLDYFPIIFLLSFEDEGFLFPNSAYGDGGFPFADKDDGCTPVLMNGDHQCGADGSTKWPKCS